MKQTGKCPKCDSHEIVAHAKAMTISGHELFLATFRNPKTLIFKGKQQSGVSAWVCATCGFIEFYADSPCTIKLPND